MWQNLFSLMNPNNQNGIEESEDESLAVNSMLDKKIRDETFVIKQHSLADKQDKENRSVKKAEYGTGMTVKQLKDRFESISGLQQQPVNAANSEPRTRGTVRKRQNSANSFQPQEERNVVVPKKRAGIDDDFYAKPASFTVYTEEDGAKSLENSSSSVKLAENTTKTGGNSKWNIKARCPVKNLRFEEMRVPKANVELRVTPAEPHPKLAKPEKVKALHRKNLMVHSNHAANTSMISSCATSEEPYEECFMEYEVERERTIADNSMKSNNRNITIGQRKIIVRFLTRLNAHLFLPSFFLYQTVRLFDAVLDAKEIDIKDLQLYALAAMWIALKREHTVYNIPTAQKMISFSNDLYGGKPELLLQCEMDILKTLDFNIVFPDPYSIFYFNMKSCIRYEFMNSSQVRRAYGHASYMIDISLFHEELMKVSTVLLAAVVAETALCFTMEEIDGTSEPCWGRWRTLDTTKRFSNEELNVVRSLLLKKTSESVIRHSDTEVVFKKYTRSRYGRIANSFGTKVQIYIQGK